MFIIIRPPEAHMKKMYAGGKQFLLRHTLKFILISSAYLNYVRFFSNQIGRLWFYFHYSYGQIGVHELFWLYLVTLLLLVILFVTLVMSAVIKTFDCCSVILNARFKKETCKNLKQEEKTLGTIYLHDERVSLLSIVF